MQGHPPEDHTCNCCMNFIGNTKETDVTTAELYLSLIQSVKKTPQRRVDERRLHTMRVVEKSLLAVDNIKIDVTHELQKYLDEVTDAGGDMRYHLAQEKARDEMYRQEDDPPVPERQYMKICKLAYDMIVAKQRETWEDLDSHANRGDFAISATD